nr:uncharacterized protein LOC112211174 [Halyomorpha halys]
MFRRSTVFLAFLCTAFVMVHSSGGLRSRRSAHYHGPLAPLNKDGTVALTPEVQQARAAHEAAIAAEFKRLDDAKRLAAAHPDMTSPPHHVWSVHKDNPSPFYQDKGYHADVSATSGYHSQGSSYDKGHYSTSGQYMQGPSHKIHMPAPLNKDGTVALTPEVQQAKKAHGAAFDAELKRLMEAQSQSMAHPDLTSSQEYAAGHYEQDSQSGQGHSYSKNPEAQMPAPLNPDGTVAQTAAYKAIASSLMTEYDKVLHNIKHLVMVAMSSTLLEMWILMFQSVDGLCIFCGIIGCDCIVGSSLGYSSIGVKRSGSTIIFAFLGLALAFEGKLSDEVLSRDRRSAPYHGPAAPLNHDGTVALTPEVHHARAAHHAAFAAEFKRLHEADSLAAAHPDYTSPPDHGWNQEVYASGYSGQGSYSAGHYGQGAAYSSADYNLGPSYSSGHYSQGPSYSSEHYNQGPSYSSGHYSQGSSYKYNPEAHIPAPLNPDGTVAQTAAYNAIASYNAAEYAKAIHRLKHEIPHFQQSAAHNYHY